MSRLRPATVPAFWLGGALGILAALATDAETVTAPPYSWAEHLDVVAVLVVLLFGYLTWSIKRTLERLERRADGNAARIADLFERLDRFRIDFEHLRTEHEVIHRGEDVPVARRHRDDEGSAA